MDATDALIAALDDPDVAVRSEVAWALGETGTEKAHLALTSAVESEANAETRAAADAALARIEQAMDKALVPESAGAALLRMLGQVPADALDTVRAGRGAGPGAVTHARPSHATQAHLAPDRPALLPCRGRALENTATTEHTEHIAHASVCSVHSVVYFP